VLGRWPLRSGAGRVPVIEAADDSHLTLIKLVRTPADVVDLGQGFAEVVGDRVSGGDAPARPAWISIRR